jgi:transcriptional antiterminator RfaH
MVARYIIGGQWVVCQTEPNRERWAAENVVNQGRECYLPKIEILKGAARLIRPLFSRYLFVRVINDQWRFLTGTRVVTGIVAVTNNGMPGTIANQYIDELKAREDSNGLVRLPTAAEEGFSPGQSVRVRAGLMEGRTGIYEGMDAKGREMVLMSILGQRTVILFAHNDLEKV